MNKQEVVGQVVRICRFFTGLTKQQILSELAKEDCLKDYRVECIRRHRVVGGVVTYGVNLTPVGQARLYL